MCSDQDTEESHAQPGKTRGGRAEGGTKADPYSSSAKIYSQKRQNIQLRMQNLQLKMLNTQNISLKKASAVK